VGRLTAVLNSLKPTVRIFRDHPHRLVAAGLSCSKRDGCRLTYKRLDQRDWKKKMRA
jgi:hypothetical protein